MTQDVYQAIQTACSDLGLSVPLDSIVFDGKIHRYHDPQHDKHGEQNGWFKGCDNGDGSFGGTVGHWRLGCKRNWNSRSKAQFTPEEKAAYAKKMMEARQREAEAREFQYQQAAQRAEALWKQARHADHSHPYLKCKQIKPHGVRQFAKQLVIPLRDAAGKLWCLQYISEDGSKMFLRGGRVQGCYWSCGSQPDAYILLAEGFATSATLHEASGLSVAAAMSGGNMLPVAITLAEKFPAAKLIVCGDCDDHGKGQEYAERAAMAVGGTVLLPDSGVADYV